MGSKFQSMVRDFNQAMKCVYGFEAKALRISLIEEEAKEVINAIETEDPIELIDGLCDLLYVTYGEGDIFGVDVDTSSEECWPVADPALGFEEIKRHITDLESSVKYVVDAIRHEKREVSKKLTDLAAGCWMTAQQGLGLDLAPFFEEVHRTNMLKLTGPVREDGKRLKPEGWKPPRIADMYAKRKGMPCPEDTP